MSWGDALSGIAGGLQGAVGAYKWLDDTKREDARHAEDVDYRDRALAQQGDISEKQRQLQLILEELQEKHGINILNKQQEHATAEAEKQRVFGSNEARLNRNWQSDEAGKSRTFTGSENALERGLRRALTTMDIGSREKIATQGNEMDAWRTGEQLKGDVYRTQMGARSSMAGVAQRGQAAAQRGAFGEGGPDPTTPSYATMFDNEPPAPQFTPAPVGRSGGNPGQPSVGAIKVFPNGRKARWDGMGWVPIQ